MRKRSKTSHFPKNRPERGSKPDSRRDEKRDDSRKSRETKKPRGKDWTKSPEKAARQERSAALMPPPKAAYEKPKPQSHPAIRADLFGTHAVYAAWRNPSRFVHALYLTDNAAKEFEDFLKSSPLPANMKRPAPVIVSKDSLDRAFPSGTVHQGIALSCAPLAEVNVMDIIIKAQGAPRSVILILDHVTDPHNVGAILRSACAFGAAGVVMQSRHAPALTGVLAKTACGAVEHLPIASETNLSRSIETLQEHGYTIIGLDEHAKTSLADLPKPARVVFVLGAEGTGMRRLIRDHCDHLVTLPTRPPIASLNVSNAAAVALYALCA